jgi:hypothetical protein
MLLKFENNIKMNIFLFLLKIVLKVFRGFVKFDRSTFCLSCSCCCKYISIIVEFIFFKIFKIKSLSIY